VILSARLYGSQGNRIDYTYDTVADRHHVWVAGSADLAEGSAGVAISALAPYRDSREVRELIAWLAK
jgi:hypothetical protein